MLSSFYVVYFLIRMIDDTKPRTFGLSCYVSSLRHCKADGFWWAGKMGWDPGTSSPFWIESCNGYFVTSLAHVCLTSLFPHFSLLFLKNFWLCNHSEFCIVCFTVPWELKLLATFCCCIWWRLRVSKGQFLSFYEYSGWVADRPHFIALCYWVPGNLQQETLNMPLQQ